MWQLDPQQQSAALTNEWLAARVFLDQPELGVGGITWQRLHLPTANLLRVTLSSKERTPVIDCYVRGSDIVVTYGDAPTQKNVRPQVYWRAVDETDSDARGIELVLSLETDLLQSDPHARLESTIPGHSIMAMTDRGWEPIGGATTQLRPPHAKPLVLVRGDGWSYAEMIYPGDFTQCTVDGSAGLCRITWDLFQEHLEKGVIRRARARGVFIPSRDDFGAARAAYERFENAPLPLTT